MKKSWIIGINILIVLLIMGFVFLYAGMQSRRDYQSERQNFESMTVAMEQVTRNYLEGEQRICDVWTKHINSSGMTMEEAVEFVRGSHVLQQASGHLIYIDDGSLEGLSTRPRAGTADDYSVSYQDLDIFQADQIGDLGEGLNITRAYLNPLNGTQSIAFYNKLTLRDPEDGSERQAALLRVVPLSELEGK